MFLVRRDDDTNGLVVVERAGRGKALGEGGRCGDGAGVVEGGGFEGNRWLTDKSARGGDVRGVEGGFEAVHQGGIGARGFLQRRLGCTRRTPIADDTFQRGGARRAVGGWGASRS